MARGKEQLAISSKVQGFKSSRVQRFKGSDSRFKKFKGSNKKNGKRQRAVGK
ncbi:MAG: hypothetical protein IPH20_25610 [Bacteroidales bacterium]|nr:hypothetical protein [Bacteroidales bacterium]